MNRAAVILTVGIILVSLTIIYWVSQWEIPVEETSFFPDTPEWVLLQPQKCHEIPWRKEWSIQNQKPYGEFPLEEEVEIMTLYYSEKGIIIIDASFTYQPPSEVCHACGCPEPFVFALLVNPNDAARLAVSGFTILDTGDPYIFTGPLFRQSTSKPVTLVTESECASVFSTSTFIDQIFGSKKDSCYIQAAISTKDPNVCNNITNTPVKYNCLSEVAVATKNANVCDQIPSASAYASCISGVAGITQNKSLCTKITDPSAQNWCELGANP